MAANLIIGDIFIKWVCAHIQLYLIESFILVLLLISISQSDYMTCYSTYINNYNTAIATINECRKSNPAFLQYLKVSICFLLVCYFQRSPQIAEVASGSRMQRSGTWILYYQSSPTTSKISLEYSFCGCHLLKILHQEALKKCPDEKDRRFIFF